MLHKEQGACVSFFHEVEMSSTQRVWPNLSFMKGIWFFSVLFATLHKAVQAAATARATGHRRARVCRDCIPQQCMIMSLNF